ncbi:hypothetical protein BC826DRAFT_57381 [Russula brevipes]|nr:hypothetical protein BC826DRAFT_57381 [Russula brevipes]
MHDMSVDTVNDVLGAIRDRSKAKASVSLVDDTGISGNQPRIARHFQFGYPAATFDFDFTVTPPTGCHPQNGGNRALRREEVQSVSSVGQYPLRDGDRTFSSSGTFTPNDPSFDNQENIPHIWALRGDYRPLSDGARRRVSHGGTHIDLSPGHPTRFAPHSAQGESMSSDSKQPPVGWTYRQILEIVAFPPPDAPHLWHVKVLWLATQLGMPREATGKDIVCFVIRAATMKNELERVVPLIKAIAAVARVLEGRAIVPSGLLPDILDLYPAAARMHGINRAGVGTNTSQRCSDEIPFGSTAGKGKRPSLSPSDEEGDSDGYDNEPARGLEEEDLHCHGQSPPYFQRSSHGRETETAPGFLDFPRLA